MMQITGFIDNDVCLDKARKMDNYLGISERFILRSLPHGNFFSYFGKGMNYDKIVKVEFERKLPKISQSILNRIVHYFRSDLSIEMVVRIYFNKQKGQYFYVCAEGKKEKDSIEYDFAKSMDIIMNPDNILAMEIHSHNRLPARFSKQDDADEVYPGVFGVIGNLDREVPSIKIRAGVDGLFVNLPWKELFD